MIKKVFFLLLAGFPVCLMAQAVSNVSYNPSRLGKYTQLKASDKIVFQNGLETTQLRYRYIFRSFL